MITMYLVFFAVSAVLFALIVWYSWHQKNKSEKQTKKDYIDPLFEELEEQKKEIKKKQLLAEEPVLTDVVTPSADQQANDKKKEGPQVEQVNTDSTESDEGRKAPQFETQIKPDPASAKDSSGTFVTELVAKVKNEQAIEQQDLLAILRKHDYKFNRKIHLYGLNELTDLWRDVEYELPSARFLELGVSIQLADRNGCMSKKELHDFQQMVLEYSDRYNARFEFSMDLDEALQQAIKLDEVGRRYDSMAVLNVVPKSKTGFRLADIETCARDLRMTTDNQGIFIKTKGQKQALTILYRLACTDGSGHFGMKVGSMTPVHDLVIYMNVPATQDPVAVFQEMIQDANSLATWLDGKVVDRHGKVMTQRSYSLLISQIDDIVLKMKREGLTPGDDISKKLF